MLLSFRAELKRGSIAVRTKGTKATAQPTTRHASNLLTSVWYDTAHLETEVLYMNIKIVLETGEDGYIVAHVPALKSCWSQGKTREEALQNIREAIDLYLESEQAVLEEDEN